MPLGIMHTELVDVCIFTGDPGCLGYPAWIDHPQCDCEYDRMEFHFCDCGGNDVYGEMSHTENCPLFKNAANNAMHATGLRPSGADEQSLSGDSAGDAGSTNPPRA